MAKKIKMVVANFTSDYWKLTEGTKFVVLKSYFYNGEGYYKVSAEGSNEVRDLPDVFFNEVA